MDLVRTETLYVLVIEKKERLVNGFRYIKELIYNRMSMKIFTLFNIVVSKRVVPKGIKTDAILVSESQDVLEKLFRFNSQEIGGLKFESGKCYVDSRIFQRQNDPFRIRSD